MVLSLLGGLFGGGLLSAGITGAGEEASMARTNAALAGYRNTMDGVQESSIQNSQQIASYIEPKAEDYANNMTVNAAYNFSQSNIRNSALTQYGVAKAWSGAVGQTA